MGFNNPKFNYEIKEQIAVLSESEDGRYTTEVNLISYNGAPAKLDIRKWNRAEDRMGKGVTLNEEEAEKLLYALMNRRDRRGKNE